MRFLFIEKHRSSFPVKKMCHVLRVSQSGYYRWRKTPISQRDLEREQLKYRIRELFAEHNGMAGSPMITADLHDFPEYANVSRPRVARLMRSMGLKCRSVKKYIATTNSKHSRPASPNILDRNLAAESPNKAWVSDITYLKVGRNWHYLTVFIDLFSRKVVGWDLSASLERYTVIRALHKAIMSRNPGEGLLIHSDRGIQYASRDFRSILEGRKFVQSMSRKGDCWDNAVAESFFHTIKNGLIHHKRFRTVAEAEQAIFNWIEVYYNRRRKHSTNGQKSPAQYELEWRNEKEVA